MGSSSLNQAGRRVSKDGHEACAQVARRVNRFVAERFAHLTGLAVQLIPLRNGQSARKADRVPPAHPECSRSTDPDVCDDQWGAIENKLIDCGQAHCYRCPFDCWCAAIPIVCQDGCRLACKLVAPPALKRSEFARHVELMGVLIENFHARELGLLDGDGPMVALDESCRKTLVAFEAINDRNELEHPRVRKAMEYIDQHFADPDLSVESAADALDLNANYLAHLFAEHAGIRMSQYIRDLRLTKAKQLLSTTDWQIKRVAEACGYPNRAWFTQVFKNKEGLTPGEYRDQAHRPRG